MPGYRPTDLTTRPAAAIRGTTEIAYIPRVSADIEANNNNSTMTTDASTSLQTGQSM